MKLKSTKRLNYILLILALGTFTSCGDALLNIGDTYQGGKIAYLFQQGDVGYEANVQHGLIAATEDQAVERPWAEVANQTTSVDGTFSTIGSGSNNTDLIIAQNGPGSDYAAGLAKAYDGGDYTDWYLPSEDELNKLYVNRVAIGGFNYTYTYWSSSQDSATMARGQDFSDGGQHSYTKDVGYAVRAVRTF